MGDPGVIGSRSGTATINDCWKRIGVWGDRSCKELGPVVHCRNCPVYSAAAVQLLDGELSDEHLAEWTNHFAQAKQLQERDTRSAVIFRLGVEWLALPTAVFKEVAPPRPIHSLPHRRTKVVLGVVNIRGELLICISLGELLGLESQVEKPAAKNKVGQGRLMVISREGRHLVFPVDALHGIHRYNEADLSPAPATVSNAAATYTRGMLAWRKSVGFLDSELLFHTLSRSLE